MKFTHDTLLAFLLCSYATGWVLNALQARSAGRLDLCQFIRWFVFAPFVFTLSSIFSTLAILAVIPNLVTILEVVAIVIGGFLTLGLFGYFVVMPAVKKAHGVTKPFSDKVCVVLYRGK